MIETATLATYIVGSFLVPLAKKGAEKLTDELSEAMGSAASEGLVGVGKKLWERIRGKTRDTDDAAVVDLFEKQPERMQAPLEEVVRQLLEEDPEFRQEASDLLEASSGEGSTHWQMMGEYVAALDARGAHISGGQVAAMIIGAPAPGPPVPQEPAGGRDG